MCKYKALVSILAIGIVEMYALYLGMNGTALSLSVGAMAGLGGYELHKKGVVR